MPHNIHRIRNVIIENTRAMYLYLIERKRVLNNCIKLVDKYSTMHELTQMPTMTNTALTVLPVFSHYLPCYKIEILLRSRQMVDFFIVMENADSQFLTQQVVSQFDDIPTYSKIQILLKFFVLVFKYMIIVFDFSWRSLLFFFVTICRYQRFS